MKDSKWSEQLEKGVPYVPNAKNSKISSKLAIKKKELLGSIKEYKQSVRYKPNKEEIKIYHKTLRDWAKRDSKVELCKDGKDTWFIRKGMFRHNCVTDSLTIKDLSILMRKIDKIVNKGI